MDNGARSPYFVALFEAAKALHSSLDLQAVLSEIVRNSAEGVGAKGAALLLLDRIQRELSLAASYGLSQEYLEKGPIRPETSSLDRRILAGEPVVISNRSEHRFQYPEAA